MDLLSNSIFQFIVNSSLTTLTIILAGISIWLVVRQTGEMPSYEGISYESVNLSDTKTQQLLTNLHIPIQDKSIRFYHFLTFKLSNPHKEPLIFDEKRPLIIGFNNIPILSCEKIETFPDDLEYKYHLDEGKLFLRLPQLDRKESLALRVLIPTYMYDFPDIRVRGRAPKPTIKANNIRRSKEMFIMGILYLFATVYLFFNTRSLSSSPLHYYLWLFLGTGLLFFMLSWADRKMPPSQLMLPSQWFYLLFIMFLYSLRVFIPIGILGFLIYLLFGARILTLLFLISVMITIPFCTWYLLYSSLIGWLKKKQKKHSALLIGILTSMPFIAFYIMCASVVIYMLVHW